jgi:hypothetical protein
MKLMIIEFSAVDISWSNYTMRRKYRALCQLGEIIFSAAFIDAVLKMLKVKKSGGSYATPDQGQISASEIPSDGSSSKIKRIHFSHSIASTGQTSLHAPHSVQTFLSMT